MDRLLPLALVLALGACAALKPQGNPGPLPPGMGDPVPSVVEAPKPPPTARTAEEFDTTTAAERQAAVAAPAAAGETKLGTTIAALGDPSLPGFWLETPLVKSVRQGHVSLVGGDATVQVELRPIGGPASGGSRISLAAMRLLGAALTDLPELEVFGG